MPPAVSSKQIGDAGEHYVACELARRGINPAMLSQNALGADILATIDGEITISIQVKTAFGRTEPRKWLVGRHKPKETDTFFYIFINLWEDFHKVPECFIVPSNIVRERVAWSERVPSFKLKDETEAKRFLDAWNQIYISLGIK